MDSHLEEGFTLRGWIHVNVEGATDDGLSGTRWHPTMMSQIKQRVEKPSDDNEGQAMRMARIRSPEEDCVATAPAHGAEDGVTRL